MLHHLNIFYRLLSHVNANVVVYFLAPSELRMILSLHGGFFCQHELMVEPLPLYFLDILPIFLLHPSAPISNQSFLTIFSDPLLVP